MSPPAQQDIARPAVLRRRLLAWYDRNRRTLPWRAPPGATADPYRVWLSEIMLQQTSVATVIPYYNDFVTRWPDVEALAAARTDEVLHAWQGLGYYARARNLLRCATVVAGDLGGRFPDNEKDLRRLPGIGPYTAAAIAAIAFGRRTTPVDGNVLRVIARFFAVDEPLPGAGAVIASLAAGLTPGARPGDFAQALMDLGATVCVPRRPACSECPWEDACTARRMGRTRELPRKLASKAKPTRRGVAFWLRRADGAVLIRRRPEKGLLGGMMEFPGTEWRLASWTLKEARRHAPVAGSWRPVPGVVRHTFTHFHLELTVLAARVNGGGDGNHGGVWCPLGRLSDHALPTVMKKVARHAFEGAPSG
ncbi:MAG: A/G-specific adenine glycosylase [Rhodospirillales bacterium]|jgi:A/G-specific adenine glycosylase|nr:A/G-specific adenine glycosylase [Rhodospirillales bacterium]MDP6774089.1 A/G-specific adenine glycosylase [Rhodospirillales bacterium]